MFIFHRRQGLKRSSESTGDHFHNCHQVKPMRSVCLSTIVCRGLHCTITGHTIDRTDANKEHALKAQKKMLPSEVGAIGQVYTVHPNQ